MITSDVGSDSLAALLLLERDFEPTPEVFRCQPTVIFYVDFQEYINFCSSYLGKTDYLTTPSRELQKLVREYRLGSESAKNSLFSAFLKDMAFAVCKELHFAEALGKGATNIVHVTESRVLLTQGDIDKYFVNVAERVFPILLSRLANKGYALPSQISARNAHLFKYAVVMYYLSDQPFQWSYQLQYK